MYGGEWVQSDGRWSVTVAGLDDTMAIPVFDAAARSFGDEPVFGAVVIRLESELALDTDADSAVSELTRVVGGVEPDPTADDQPPDTDSTLAASRVTAEPHAVVPSDDGSASDPDESPEVAGPPANDDVEPPDRRSSGFPSTALITPVGRQAILLVYGPEGYRFTDYLRLGAPL